MIAQELFDQLSAPFPVEMIEWRVGPTNEKHAHDGEAVKGQPLCYIDARAVMDRLDSVCGMDGWQCNYTVGLGGAVICNLGIKVDGGWIWKADGAGATDMEGEKGAMSDALKRAAVRFGVGRYLYELKAQWIPLEKRGRSVFIPDAERKKLNNFYEDFVQKCGWGTPTDVATYRFLLSVVRATVTQPHDAEEFRKKNASMFQLLRVAQRNHLNKVLDGIGNRIQEAAE